MSDELPPFDEQCVNLDQSNNVRSIRVPYISASNIYCDSNLYVQTVNDRPVNSIITAANLDTGVGLYAGATGSTLNFKSVKTTPKLAVADLSTNVTFDANTGATADTLTAGNDGRLSDSRTVRVKSANPGNGEYNSVYSAITFVATQIHDANNRWVIHVGPGVYTEPLLVVPAFVSIVGENILQTIIQPDGAHDAIQMSNQCEVSFLTVRNVPNSHSAFVFNDVGVFAMLHKITVSNCWRGVYITSPTVASEIYLEYVDVSDQLTQGIYANCAQATLLNMENTYVLATTVAPQFCMQVAGNVTATIYTGEIIGFGGPGIICAAGAHCEMKAYQITDCSTGIADVSNDTGAAVELVGIDFESCVTNISIANPLTTGYYFGNVELAKISVNASSSFFISNQGNQSITVAKKGGNFTTIGGALAYITGANSSNIFTIRVGPGVYTENTLVMKPYVNIIGSGIGVTIVQAATVGMNLIVGAVNTIISDMDFRGDTASGSCAIIYTGSATSGIFAVYRCHMVSGDIMYRLTATSGAIQSEFAECEILASAAPTTCIMVDNGGTSNVCVGDVHVFKSFNPSNMVNMVDVSGTTTSLSLNTFGVTKINGTGIGINVYNGATIAVLNGLLTGFNVGISAPNVGAASTITIMGILCKLSTTYDLSVLHTGTTGSIGGVFKQSQVNVDPAVTGVVFNYSNLDTAKGSVIVGKLSLGPTATTTVNISDVVNGQNVGLASGGVLSVGSGLAVNVSAATGYVIVNPGPSQYLAYITYAGGSLGLPASTSSYIYINANGTLTSGATRPDNTLNLTLGRVYTNATGVEFIDASAMEIGQFGNHLDSMFKSVFGAIYQSGSTTTVNTSLQLSVTSGIYWLSDDTFAPSGITNGSFRQYYQLVSGWNISTQTTVTNTQYNTGGALTSISAGQYVKHSLFTVGAGVNEQYLLVVGQAQFASSTLAFAGANVIPSAFVDGVVPIAELVVQQGSTTVAIKDVRPRPAYAAQLTTNTVISHSSLSNLNADDHLQYLPVNGTRSMAADLNMGNNNIVSAGNINGVAIAAHASRHLPNGADALAVGAPVTIAATNATGIVNSFARSDHVHAHGAQTDPTMHAVATTLASGFMSSGDKTKLDAGTSAATASAIVQRDASSNAAVNQLQLASASFTSGSFATTVQGSSAATVGTVITLPPNSGASGQFLATDGAGTTSWTSIGLSANRVISTISAIVSIAQNNYVVRLGAPVALSGSAAGFTITPGNNSRSDAINYTGTVSLARVYISLRFASVTTLTTVSITISSTGATGGSRSASASVPANQNGYTLCLSAETGGTVAGNDILASITWGSPRAITLISGYMIVGE